MVKSWIKLGLRLSFVMLLVGCGRISNQEQARDHNTQSFLSTTTVHPTETVDAINATLHAQATAFAQSPTLEPAAEATYWADRDREAEYYDATVAAGGPTRTLSPDFAAIATSRANGTRLTPFLSPVPRVIGRHYGCFDIPDRTITVHDCWFMVDTHSQYELVLYTKDADPSVSYILVETQTLQTQDVATRYSSPRTVEPLYIHHTDGAQIYFATIADHTSVVLRLNLETRQWLDPSGTPIPVTATPTSTSAPTVATPTPAGGITVTSLTLFDADTDQPLIGFDPMDSTTVLDFVALGTRRLNIRANTSPATVGSVRFSLDGAPYRIEGGAPYALQGNTGSDYTAWTPSAGQHQLVVTAFSGANATGTQGGSFTLDFTVVDSATATAEPATATATGIPASITPVPATPTSASSTSTPSTPKTALFVVGDATALNASDTMIQSLLVGEGYTVSLKSAAQSSSADATGKQLVLISSSVAAGNVGTKFTNVAVPVIVWEHAIYDDLGMTGPTTTTDYGTATGNSLVISNATHGLAGGLSGTVTVYTGSGTMAYGVPASSAISIAPQGSSNSKKVYFGYAQGATMVGNVVAPARRVGLFLSDSGTLSTDGQTLVKAAFAWATGQ
ncbi:hypothetical protein [Herpetosiphon llansteffanensis]|uniref:hypothetical protein n=1 Tax=Herpetosiphon llansteffanensis TaxID=2094568 RepID=UPI000F51A921|nr:hypothetical protein [Herpetosiphon llansteffanensis]